MIVELFYNALIAAAIVNSLGLLEMSVNMSNGKLQTAVTSGSFPLAFDDLSNVNF